MLIELAIGDGYGAGHEYAPAEFVAANNNLNQYFKHNLEGFLPAGSYTDDTQMTIAITEALVSGLPWTRQNLAAAYVRCFKRDPRNTYSRGFQALLTEVKDGDELLARIEPNSDRSGAAMRACPLGLIPDLADAFAKCEIQARITHDTEDGVNAALATVAMTHFFAYNIGPRHEVFSFMSRNVSGDWSPWSGKVKAQGWMSVRAAATAIVDSDGTLSDILRRSIAFTGDVDTVGTLSMGASSLSRDIKKDLPQVLFDGLENREWGRDYLGQLEPKLFQAVGYNPR